MTATKKGLGRGLSALIPDADMDYLSEFTRSAIAPTTPAKPSPRQNSIKKASAIALQELAPPQVPEKAAIEELSPLNPADSDGTGGTDWLNVAQIKPNPYQPRRFFSDEEMSELVSSIRTHGLLQPVLVRPAPTSAPDEPAMYQLVAGERRWRAAQLAGLDKIPVVVRQVDDQQALELALIENVQRHDISAIDAAIAYQRLAGEFSLSQEQIAQRVGKSRSAVANTVRLLDLPQEVRKAIEDGALSEGHGRAILLAPGDGARRAIFRRVLRDKLSVRETERLAQHSVDMPDPDENGKTSSAGNKGTESQDTVGENELGHLEEELQKLLGTKLQLKVRRKGGELVINFSSKDEMERIINVIRGSVRK